MISTSRSLCWIIFNVFIILKIFFYPYSPSWGWVFVLSPLWGYELTILLLTTAGTLREGIYYIYKRYVK